jgi:peptidoglycan/LPS O-acetylase OafA/YrhL
MKAKISSIFWGIVLILVAAVLLAERLNYIHLEDISNNIWVFIFAGGSLLFFLSYFLNGVRKWGWLFPAFVLAALSITIWMAENHFDGPYMGTPILASVALPFYVGFLVDRKNWGLLIPAWVLTVLTVITLLADRVNGTLIGGLFLFAAALPFLIVYLFDRKRWWALIPTWVLFVLGMITLFSEIVDGDLIGAFFLYSVALPFLVVYLMDRKRRWALIPAAILGVLGTIPLLASLIGGDVMGAFVMFLFAVPFFIAYFRSRDNWWALIPAGVFTTIGVVVVLGMVLPDNMPILEGIMTGILFLGFGLTFGLLWLRRKTLPTAWAKYPAIGLLVAAVLAFALGSYFQSYWAVVLLIAGILMVVAGLRPKKQDAVKPIEEKPAEK